MGSSAKGASASTAGAAASSSAAEVAAAAAAEFALPEWPSMIASTSVLIECVMSGASPMSTPSARRRRPRSVDILSESMPRRGNGDSSETASSDKRARRITSEDSAGTR